ncbi:unnamed protein product [Rhizophagus irregularis]|nr:unnamed protein product [Rhizophagus irregularis]
MVLSRATSLQLDINDEQNDNVDYIEEIKENIRERGKGRGIGRWMGHNCVGRNTCDKLPSPMTKLFAREYRLLTMNIP